MSESLVAVGLRLVRTLTPLVRYGVVERLHRTIVRLGSMLAQSSPPQQARLHRATLSHARPLEKGASPGPLAVTN
jgi:hypothetical protein